MKETVHQRDLTFYSQATELKVAMTIPLFSADPPMISVHPDISYLDDQTYMHTATREYNSRRLISNTIPEISPDLDSTYPSRDTVIRIHW